jgi:hypothetical protein
MNLAGWQFERRAAATCKRPCLGGGLLADYCLDKADQDRQKDRLLFCSISFEQHYLKFERLLERRRRWRCLGNKLAAHLLVWW